MWISIPKKLTIQQKEIRWLNQYIWKYDRFNVWITNKKFIS